jgi:hypothetical protein
MSWTIRPLPTEGELFDDAIHVYGEAFSRPPYRDNDRGRDVRQRMDSSTGAIRRSARSVLSIRPDGWWA